MGWSGGSHIMREIIKTAMNTVPKKNRREFYTDMIDLLEGEDWDTQDEALGLDPIFDAIMVQIIGDRAR
jgi:hypothetical protein